MCQDMGGAAPNRGKCAELRIPECGFAYKIPNSLRKSAEYCGLDKDTCKSSPGGEGVSDADIAVIISAGFSSSCRETMEGAAPAAFAAICQRDAYDRPTISRIHVCSSYLGRLENGTVAAAESAQYTMIHELFHAIGFASDSLPLFRRGDGTPLVPRENGNFGNPRNIIKFQCPYSARIHTVVNHSSNSFFGSEVPDNTDLSQPIGIYPLNGIIEAFSERHGVLPCPCQYANWDKEACGLGSGSDLELDFWFQPCVLKMVTPNVVRQAREFFDCPTLNGLELENALLGDPCNPINMHWESRLLMNAIMAGTANPNLGDLYVTPMTLAFFEDSSWFRPDYSKATPVSYPGNWGYKQGCDFALKRCISSETQKATSSRFCDTLGAETCSLDRKSAGRCRMSEYAKSIPASFRLNDLDDRLGASISKLIFVL